MSVAYCLLYPAAHLDIEQGRRAKVEMVKPVVVEPGEVRVRDGEAGDVALDGAAGRQDICGSWFWFEGLRGDADAHHLGGKVWALTYWSGNHLQHNCL